MKYLIAAAAALGGSAALGGCATGMAGGPMRYCIVAQGYAKGSPEYRDCMAEQLAVLKVRGDAQKERMIEAVAVGAAAYGEAKTPSIVYVPAQPGQQPSTRQRTVFCPDGRWAAGSTCAMLPDGRWVGVP